MTAQVFSLSISEEVPGFFRSQFDGLAQTFNAPLRIEYCQQSKPLDLWVGEYLFAAVAQFPTISDGITSDFLIGLWSGEISSETPFTQLIVIEEYEKLFTFLWGNPD